MEILDFREINVNLAEWLFELHKLKEPKWALVLEKKKILLLFLIKSSVNSIDKVANYRFMIASLSLNSFH